MHDVKNMLERVLCLLAWVRELSQELGLHNWMRLSDDQVVSILIFVKSILQEVGRSRIKCSLHTEQSYCESILKLLWSGWDRGQVVNLLNNLLDLIVFTVSFGWFLSELDLLFLVIELLLIFLS